MPPKDPRKPPNSAWSIAFFDDEDGSTPARDFLELCPTSVRANLIAVVKAVAEAPPPRFGGGGKWEAMHGDMKGFYEVRGTGPKRRQYRLFCLLDHRGRLPEGPALVLITGMSKPHLTEFSARDYARVRRLGEDYRSRPSARYQVSDS